MSTTLTTAEKNKMVKDGAIEELNIPENAIQYGDYSFAIPVTVDGESRFAKVTIQAANNKDTKTTSAFDPDLLRQVWLEETENKKVLAEAKKKAKAK